MSRIFGIYRAGGTVRAGDAERVDAALQTMPGAKITKMVYGGACLGRISFSNDDLGGGVAQLGDWLVVLDGCILNADQICQDGDFDHATVLARLLAQEGADAVPRVLEGDFAAAAYDARNDHFLLIRDRLGVKPLYWAKIDGGMACASQPRALLGLPGVSNEPNWGFVARFAGSHYRTFDNFPTQSPYADVNQVPAGTSTQIRRTAASAPRPYWQLEDVPDFTGPEGELAEQYRALLLDAVAKRVRASRRPAFTLSGGLDSSSVLCCADTVTGRKQPAVSGVYRDPTFDERNEIGDVAVSRPGAWTAVEIPDEIALIDEIQGLVRLHNEPVATATWLSHERIASRVAAQGHTALFGGLGGDELNAGEYEYFPFFFADLKSAGRTSELETEIAAWGRLHDHPIYRKNRQSAHDLLARLVDPSSPGRCLPDGLRLGRYMRTIDPEFTDPAAFRPTMEAPFTSYLKNRTFQDMFRETLPCCLRAEDRQCTAAGLQHFDPFLDHHVIEFMYRVPGTSKIRNGITKQLLRLAMQGILPERTRTRVAKVGWNAPAHVWFAGRNLADVRDLIASRTFRERGIYQVGEVERLIDEHVEIVAGGFARENHMMFLWQLVNLELWLQAIPEISGSEAARPSSLQTDPAPAK